MKDFELPEDLKYNNGFVMEPAKYLEESGCKSWLFLIGEEFSKMENGMSYQQGQRSDPILRQCNQRSTAGLKS